MKHPFSLLCRSLTLLVFKLSLLLYTYTSVSLIKNTRCLVVHSSLLLYTYTNVSPINNGRCQATDAYANDGYVKQLVANKELTILYELVILIN